MPSQIHIMLVEDNLGDRRLVELSLQEELAGAFTLEAVDRLAAALTRLDGGGVDLILLDLGLPDSGGIATFQRLTAVAQAIPIVVLSGLGDDAVAVEAVTAGAQDYVVKGETAAVLLPRIVRYALERHRLQQQLRDSTLFDELTGLFNRRGFLTLAEQQLKLSERTNLAWLLFLADVDHFKEINDSLGHAEGDRALVAVAQVLRQSFRGSDIVARLGGDEFVCCAIGATEQSAPFILERIWGQVVASNALTAERFTLALSVGWAVLRPGTAVEDALAAADARMYEDKSRKRRQAG